MIQVRDRELGYDPSWSRRHQNVGLLKNMMAAALDRQGHLRKRQDSLVMMGWYDGNGSGSWGWVGMIGMSVFWLALLGIIVFALFKPLSGSAGRTEDRAIVLLRERFARGEITVEQFDQARQTLMGSSDS